MHHHVLLTTFITKCYIERFLWCRNWCTFVAGNPKVTFWTTVMRPCHVGIPITRQRWTGYIGAHLLSLNAAANCAWVRAPSWTKCAVVHTTSKLAVTVITDRTAAVPSGVSAVHFRTRIVVARFYYRDCYRPSGEKSSSERYSNRVHHYSTASWKKFVVLPSSPSSEVSTRGRLRFFRTVLTWQLLAKLEYVN